MVENAALTERHWEHLEGLLGDFGRVFLDIVENNILIMQRVVNVSRFLYSEGLAGMNNMHPKTSLTRN